VTTGADRPADSPSEGRPARRGRVAASLGLLAALAAGGVLLSVSPDDPPAPPPGRVGVAAAWPKAQLADIPGNLADGPVFQPVFFTDARTAVGTAPSPDGTQLRLLVRSADGSIRELRRMPIDAGSQFAAFTPDGDRLAWAETAAGGRTRMWIADLAAGGAARLLTADTGNALFFDSQYDMVIADGRLHWTSAGPGGSAVTEVRSVALTGGPVQVRREKGTWSLTAWPWLVDGFGDRTGTTRLRDTVRLRDVAVPSTGVELLTCTPTWCRVMIMDETGLARIEVMHPDGTARERVAGGGAAAALTDVMVLDRFEVISEAGPDSDLTGTERLLIFDIATRSTVDLAAEAQSAAYRGGVLWWSTGDQDNTVWHTIDLRTV
jgi:hypothetical protein